MLHDTWSERVDAHHPPEHDTFGVFTPPVYELFIGYPERRS
jgi:hypothetical protein